MNNSFIISIRNKNSLGIIKIDGNICSRTLLLASLLWDAKFKSQADVSMCWRSYHFKFSYVLITCCGIQRAGNNCAIVSRSGYIWIWSGAHDQESTNHSGHFVEGKSRYITIIIIIIGRVKNLIGHFICDKERNKPHYCYFFLVPWKSIPCQK